MVRTNATGAPASVAAAAANAPLRPSAPSHPGGSGGVPRLDVLRSSQLDAARLDDELGGMLKEQFLGIFSSLPSVRIGRGARGRPRRLPDRFGNGGRLTQPSRDGRGVAECVSSGI